MSSTGFIAEHVLPGRCFIGEIDLWRGVTPIASPTRVVHRFDRRTRPSIVGGIGFWRGASPLDSEQRLPQCSAMSLIYFSAQTDGNRATTKATSIVLRAVLSRIRNKRVVPDARLAKLNSSTNAPHYNRGVAHSAS